MEITIKQEISDSRIVDLICCAFEGGINYWARLKSKKKPAAGEKPPLNSVDGSDDWGPYYYWYPLRAGGVVQLEDAEGGEKCKPLTRETIAEGLAVMAKKYPHHMNDFLKDNEDATTGDVFIQCCVFGDIVYG